MDPEIAQKLEECEATLTKLQQSPYQHAARTVQEILKKNVAIISELDSIKKIRDDQDEFSKNSIERTAVLIQELNFNLNEVVRIYQDASMLLSTSK
mmetsp:Transcript_1329/g.2157  ORF Transcript_1329/g.2157 Transcript_1329/m.2157 type:complete len:96 (+) Transcript_1329:73-360(+)